MKDFIERLSYEEEPCDLFAMSNLGPKATGIDTTIWVSPKRGNHGPRIKVAQSSREGALDFSVSISDRPEVKAEQSNVNKVVNNKMLKQIFKWIQLNEEALLKFWNSEIEYTEDLLQQLKKV